MRVRPRDFDDQMLEICANDKSIMNIELFECQI